MLTRHKTDEGIHLVNSSQAPHKNCYLVGWCVPVSGIYRAVHVDHRLAHEVTLIAGQTFPRCNKCGTQVHFELIREATVGVSDSDFRITLYEIPHPEKDATSSSTPGQVA